MSSPPTRQTLVNLPGPFAAGHPDGSDGKTWVFTIQAAGHIPSLVSGYPTYTWTFQDAPGKDGTRAAPTTLVTHDPGLLFDGVDPRDHADHYPVLHAWKNAGAGTVSLQTTWKLTYQINGQGPALDGGALTYDPITEDFTALDQRARLVDPLSPECTEANPCTGAG